jgi:hypothetical protein
MNLYGGGGAIPPDTTIGAGATSIVEAVNALGTVYNLTGVTQSNINTTGCTKAPGTDSVTDPRVLFDSSSGIWFISTATFSPIADASWNLLVSTTSDPATTTWMCLVIPTSGIQNPDATTGNFPDFPKIGINANKVVLTGDAFSPVTGGYKFQGTEYVVMNKSGLVSGTVTVALFPPDQGDFAIEPAQQLTKGSATDALYMAAVNSGLPSASNIDVWTIRGIPGDVANPLLTPEVTTLPIATISQPPNAVQQGTAVVLDTNDDSLLDASFRDGPPGSMWVSGNDACTPPGDTAPRSCLRFINVSIDPIGGISVAQDFDYADVGTYYYYPAVRTDAAGDLFASFSGSSGSTYASAYAGAQLVGNNNVLTNLSVAKAGDSPYTISPPRWGDYSGAAVDPSDLSVWLGAEYSTGIQILGNFWATEISEAKP